MEKKNPSVPSQKNSNVEKLIRKETPPDSWRFRISTPRTESSESKRNELKTGQRLTSSKMLQRTRLSIAKKRYLETLNRKIDALIIRESERGFMTPEEKTRFQNLQQMHKKLVFA